MKKFFKINQKAELIGSSNEELNKRSGSELCDFPPIFVWAENESDAIGQGIASYLTEVNPQQVVEISETSITVSLLRKVRLFFKERVECEYTVKVTFSVEETL